MYIRIWVIARSLDWEREGRKESILGYNFLVYNFAAHVGRKMLLCTVSMLSGALLNLAFRLVLPDSIRFQIGVTLPSLSFSQESMSMCHDEVDRLRALNSGLSVTLRMSLDFVSNRGKKY